MTISDLSRSHERPVRIPRQHRSSDVDANRIVVGVDTSRWGLAALSWAADHARLAGMDLDVCAAPTDSRPGTELAHQLRDIRRWAAHRTVPVLPSVDARTALIAASRRAGLVVLGCRGTGHPGLGLGHSVPAVARSAACDVVVVGGHPSAVRGAHGRICLLLADTAPADVVPSAVRFAVRRGVGLRVLGQVSPAGRAPCPDTAAEFGLVHEATELVHRLAPHLDVETDVVVGDPHEVITGLLDVDLLVVGVRGAPDALTRAALYHAVSPVLLARTG